VFAPEQALWAEGVFRMASVDDSGHRYAEGPGYHAPAGPVRAHALRLVSPEYPLRASERDSFGSGSAYSGPHALADDFPFHLCEGGE